MPIAAAAQTCQEMNLNIVPLFSVGHPERVKDYHGLVARESPSFNCEKSRRTPSGRWRGRRDRGGSVIEGGGGKWLNSWRGDALRYPVGTETVQFRISKVADFARAPTRRPRAHANDTSLMSPERTS
jgi:hypothetical protein